MKLLSAIFFLTIINTNLFAAKNLGTSIPGPGNPEDMLEVEILKVPNTDMGTTEIIFEPVLMGRGVSGGG